MSLKVHSDYALTKRIKNHKGGITFVIGSAFSQKDKDGCGIPNVDEVIQFVEDFIFQEDAEDLAYFRSEMNSSSSKDRYQAAFDIVSSLHGQSAVNEIIDSVMKSNEDESGRQRIPKPVRDFVITVKNANIDVRNVITTNFDTLIEEEFDNQNLECNSFSLVNDTLLPTDVNKLVNVFHLHGKWGQDTMHTENQLSVIRQKIEVSLQNIVKDDLVVVIAYGGWEDSFTRAIAQIVSNPALDFDILWTFYESETAIIESSKDSLIDDLNEAILRSRVQFYKGVDCNVTFEKLNGVREFKKKSVR